MENENRRSILSQKYIEVIAAHNGYQTITSPTDLTSIKIRELVKQKLPKGKHTYLFSNREIKGSVLPYSESQVKQGKGSVKFNVDPGLYNNLLETANLQRPTVLFICTWPSHKSSTIIFSKEAMSLICTCYWFLPPKKAKPASNSKSLNIEIPDNQIIDLNGFEKLFDDIYI